MYRGAQAYYSTWQFVGNKWKPQPLEFGANFPLAQGLTPWTGNCCWSQGGPDTDKNNFCDNKSKGELFSTPVWRFLNFRRTDQFRFAYSFEETGTGYLNQSLFEARVVGDLDCDGLAATFVVKGQFGVGFGNKYVKPNAYFQPFSKLAIPLEVEYIPEAPGEASSIISSTWPDETPDTWLASSVYAILLEDTYVGQYKEAFQNLLGMDAGARKYYSTPKVAAQAPVCQVAAQDQGLVGAWSDHIPAYMPLMQGLTPVQGTCCSGSGPDNDGDDLCDPDPDVWSTKAWTAIQFALFGSHRFVYDFHEYNLDGNSFEYRASASQDPSCFGNRDRIVLLGEVNGSGDCGVVRRPVLEFLPLGWSPGEAAVGVRVEKGDHWYSFLLEGEGAPGFLESTESYETSHWEAFYYLDAISAAIDEHWQSHCSLPPYPTVTPNAKDCCKPAVDTDNNDTCDANPEAWNQEFWSGIDFSIGVEHHYRFAVEGKTLSPTQTLLTIKALGNPMLCGEGDCIAFHRLGVADATAGQCQIEWFSGVNVGIWLP